MPPGRLIGVAAQLPEKPMRRYLLVTAAVFVIILGAHAARIAAEGPRLLTEPDFALASITALGLATWAVVLLRRLPAGM